MIAVYEERDNCVSLLPELQSVLGDLGVEYHILFVIAGDDGTRAYIDRL